MVETLALAMAEAHRRGVVHRDLEPSNILLTADGTPKVADLGLAKMLNAESGLTRTDSVLGSPSYMAPEQAEGWAKEIGPAADLYALGAILYELLTGRPPFRGATVLDTLQQVKSAEPVPPSRLVPRVPRDIETIVLKCLQKDPGKSYESALALAEDLRRYQAGEPILSRPVGALECGRRWCRRNPVVAGSLGSVATLLAASVVMALLYADRERRAAAEQAKVTRDKTLFADRLKTSLIESNRRIAALFHERGQATCERGEIGPGMLWTVESWRAAIKAGDPAWQHAARANLAAWQGENPRLVGIISNADAVGRGAFSPDGKLLVTGSEDGTVQLWDAATRRPKGEPLRHGRAAVRAMAFSPDGQVLLTGGFADTARLWDAATGRPKGSPMEHRGPIYAVAFSPNGKTLITGGGDKTARLWDAVDGRPLGEPLTLGDWVWGVAFSPDGGTFLTASGNAVRFWDALTGRPDGEPLTHPSPI